MNPFLRRTRHLSRPVRARLSVAPPASFPSKYSSSLLFTSIIMLSSTSPAAVTTMADFSDKGSTTSSADWSDEEGDEYLAKALASDEYLQGSRRSSSSTLPPPPQPVSMAGGAGGTPQVTAGRRGTILVHHPLCELHDIPDHPERPGRVRAIMNALTRNYPDITTTLAPEATVEQVLRFHDQPHVDKILRLCSDSEKAGRAAEAKASASASSSKGKGSRRGSPAADRHVSPYVGIVQIDPDTAVMPASRAAIFRAAGAACFAVDEVMSGGAANAFCCVRPPGHHAEPDRAMGFCFFNNAPIGALHAKATHGVERVAVVDIDVHHGNGTQALFEEDPTTFYASTHQGPEFYPGTGFDDITGVQSNIVNVSMGDGEGSGGFRAAYSEKILPALEGFRPGLIVISAGFDAHVDDPLAGITLNEDDYRWVTERICDVAKRVCGGRVVSILEGGYNLQAISDSAVAHVHALRQAAAAAAPAPAPAPATGTAGTKEATRAAAAKSPTKAPPSGTGIAMKEGGSNGPSGGSPGSASLVEEVSGNDGGSSGGGGGSDTNVEPTTMPTAAAAAAAAAAAGVGEASADGRGGQGEQGVEGESEGCDTSLGVRPEEHEEIDLMLAQLSLEDADGQDSGEKDAPNPL